MRTLLLTTTLLFASTCLIYPVRYREEQPFRITDAANGDPIPFATVKIVSAQKASMFSWHPKFLKEGEPYYPEVTVMRANGDGTLHVPSRYRAGVCIAAADGCCSSDLTCFLVEAPGYSPIDPCKLLDLPIDADNHAAKLWFAEIIDFENARRNERIFDAKLVRKK